MNIEVDPQLSSQMIQLAARKTADDGGDKALRDSAWMKQSPGQASDTSPCITGFNTSD